VGPISQKGTKATKSGRKMGLGRSLALPVLRTVSMRGSCRAVTFPVISGSPFHSVLSVFSVADLRA